MNFHFTEQQRSVIHLAREFAEHELAPGAAQRDEHERFDRGLFARLGELGLTGVPLPRSHGGRGLDFVAYAGVIEELSKVCASTGVMLSVHTSLVGWTLFQYGTEEQKRKFLLPVAEGSMLGAYSLTESGSGSDAGAMRTSAVKQGSSYILNGTKIFVTNAGEADLYIVFAVTDFQQRTRGCSAFIIEKGTPGFHVGKKEKKLGIRSSSTRELIFEDCRVPAFHLLGQEGEGFKIALAALDGGRIGIAAQALGIAQAAFDAAITWTKSRKQAAPEIAMESILAEMAAHIEAARLLAYQAAWRKSAGLPYRTFSSIAKLFASDTAMRVTSDAVQLLAQDPVTNTSAVERYFRDAKVTQIYEGTNEIQRLVISRMLLAD
ncbi:acyl-CoA dehydrogenase [Cohnella pontilimi]|uniref:Acyl-CoA dehydrogenase n=1 Tax=Cohnella pontilimi TaxID=2564100 RepID=A0A4U0FGK7_9BACL|nr:acyl-CoA dehydrogenase family protein [Cohnella pontilimi]TJY44010.1 acyl-CoA dehydrogenase [Cohnella pontilimi]